MTAVGRSTASQLAQQLAVSHMRYQAAARCVAAAAQRGVATGGAKLAAGWSKQAVLESAAKGLQAATARYSALQVSVVIHTHTHTWTHTRPQKPAGSHCTV